MILFADDLNMPKLDTYGSQPPIELLRQFVDFHGLYDREKLFWKVQLSYMWCYYFRGRFVDVSNVSVIV